jgi:hypothetical protein
MQPGFRLHWQASPANTGGLHLNLYILGVDLGKHKSVFCKYCPRTGEVQFRTVATNPHASRKEFAQDNIACVVFEPDLADNMNIPSLFTNTNAEPWRWKNIKRKTDRDDALKLAAAGEMPFTQFGPIPVCGLAIRAVVGNLRPSTVKSRLK